ncbi:MAG: ABC transporter permease, partial [Acidimicrobiales bacterium]
LADRFLGYLEHSLIRAAATAAVCVLVAVLVTSATRFGRARLTEPAIRLATVGYAVPGPVVAIGVLLAVVAADDLLERLGGNLPGVVATGSLLTLVYALSVRFLAPGLNAVEAGLTQVPETMTATARSLGHRPVAVLRRVHLPLLRTSVITATVLVVVDTLKELPIVLLLRPFDFDTLSVWTYNLASESRYQQAALPALAIIAVALIPIGLLARQLRSAEPSEPILAPITEDPEPGR